MAISHNPNHTVCHFLAFFFTFSLEETLQLLLLIIAPLPPFHFHYGHHCSYTSLLTMHQKQASFSGGSDVKNLPAFCRRFGFDPLVRKIHWRREWQPTPVFLPGEFHGQRSLVGCSLRGCKESDMTERLTLSGTGKHCYSHHLL